MKKLSDNDLIILDKENKPVRFSDGEIVIYGDVDEANEDARLHGDRVVKAIDALEYKDELLKQINN